MKPDDLFHLQTETLKQVTEIRTTLLGLDGRTGLIGTVKDHESRIRRVERWRYAIPASLIGIILSVVFAR